MIFNYNQGPEGHFLTRVVISSHIYKIDYFTIMVPIDITINCWLKTKIVLFIIIPKSDSKSQPWAKTQKKFMLLSCCILKPAQKSLLQLKVEKCKCLGRKKQSVLIKLAFHACTFSVLCLRHFLGNQINGNFLKTIYNFLYFCCFWNI